MRYIKSNYSTNTPLEKADYNSRFTNIGDLIKRNKIEEKKDKLQKIYILLGISAVFLLIVLFILA